ncbi:MAG: DegV family protein [Clostridia bacterium]|nr:DegV family protein [Clostridia bacterium]
MKIAVMADSSSGITQAEAKELGVYIAPVPVLIDEDTFYEDLTISQKQYYEKLRSNANVSTSQPNPETVKEMWENALKENDAVIYVPISSGLSQTCQVLTALANSEEQFKGKVFVVDNHRVSITQRQSVMDALKMANEGKTAQEIYDYLTETGKYSSIYIMVDTLKFLKKSGRLTPAVAAIGTLLKIKPVLQIHGGVLDQYAKVRKISDAKSTMINAVKRDLLTHFRDFIKSHKMTVCIAHTDSFDEAEKFKKEVLEAFPDIEFTFVNPLSLSVASHIGPGALAIACTIKY